MRHQHFTLLIAALLLSIGLSAQTYFWVGNGGDWSDAANWSTTSGGAGGAGVPAAGISVVFDSNSGDCVVGRPATCETISWSGDVTVTLDDELEVRDLMVHTSGTLVMNSPLRVGVYQSNSGTARTLSGTNRHFVVTGDPGLFEVNTIGYTDFAIDTLIFETNNGILQSQGQPIIKYLEFKGDGEVYGNHFIETWVFANGRTVFLENGSVQKVTSEFRTAVGLDYCSGLANVLAFLDSPNKAILQFENPDFEIDVIGFYMRRILGQNIVNGSAFVQNVLGVDGGDNGGMNFVPTEQGPRTLFWVNGDGSWNDRSHWSLSSGGAGGECVPTAQDEVVFDDNSFNTPSFDVVLSNSPVYVSELRYESVQESAFLRMPSISLRHDLTLNGNVFWDVSNLNILGVDNTVDLSITTGGTPLNNVTINSDRNVNLKDDFSCGQLLFTSASSNAAFNSNGHTMSVWSFIAVNSGMEIDLTDSEVNVIGFLNTNEIADRSTMPIQVADTDVTFTNTVWRTRTTPQYDIGFYIKGINMGSYLVEGIPAKLRKNTAHLFVEDSGIFRRLDINENTKIYDGDILTDTLIFHTNNTYELQPAKTITVNDYFQCDGDQCTPIGLRSRVAGEQASIILSASTELSMSYTNIRDNAGVGTNPFDSGTGSIDEGNNSGWSFRNPNAMERNEFLGPDTMICNSDNNFRIIPMFPIDEVDSIQWDNGTTEEYKGAQSAVLRSTKNQPAQEFDLIGRLVFSNGCSAVDTLHVIVSAAFDIELPPDATFCNNDSLIVRDLNNNPGVTYTWDDMVEGPTYAVGKAGEVIVEGQKGGCEARDTMIVDHIDLTQFSLGGDTVLCEVDNLTLRRPDGYRGALTWFDTSRGDEVNVDQSGDYWVEMTQEACTYRDSINVRIDNDFSVSLGGDTTLCNGASLDLSPGSGLGTYSWSTTETSETITVDQSGTYTIEVTAGACVAADTIVVSTISLKPPFLGDDQRICSTDSIMLSVDKGYFGDFAWSTGDTSRMIAVDQPGEYSLALIDGVCSIADTLVLAVDDAIDFDFGGDTTLCNDATLTLSSGISDADMISWSDGSDEQVRTITEAGTYELMVTRGQCSFTDAISVDYIDLNAFKIEGDSVACDGDTIQLSAEVSGNGATYEWEDASIVPMRTVTRSGIYEVTVSLENCSTSARKEVTFETPKTVDLGENRTLCAPATVTLDPMIDGATYLWQDNSTDKQYEVTESGVYSVVVTDGACTVTDEVVITIQDKPDLQIAASDELDQCEGDTVLLSANSGGIDYVWQNLSRDDVFVATESGVYHATMSFGTCVVSDTVEITFHALPQVDLGDDQTICEGDIVTLSAPQGPDYRYMWNSTNEDVSTIGVKTTGVYNVRVSDPFGCAGSDEMILTVNPLPVFDLGEDKAVCDGDPVTISAEPSFDNITWNVSGSGSSITTFDPGIITAIAELNGCSYTDSVEVTVQSYPEVNLGADTSICDGTMLSLDATTADATYEWSTGESSPTITATGSGTYSVAVTVNGCTSPDQINVEVRETPAFSISAENVICEGESTTISIENPSSEWNIEWSTGETSTSITADEMGTYTVAAELAGCSSRESHELDIEELPRFDLGDDISKCEDLATTLQVNINGASVEWQDGSIGTTYTASEEGLYVATATTPNNCVFTDDIMISNRECVGYSIYIPNAFSPNGDSRNDAFTISVPQEILIESYDLRIFDRWGGQVYRSSSITDSWNGTVGSSQAQPGVYTYTLSLTYSDDYETGATDMQSGSLLLVN